MAVMFEDQLVPDKTQSQTLPTNWVDQCQCVQTSELLQSSEEWKLCKNDDGINAGQNYKSHQNSEYVVMGGL